MGGGGRGREGGGRGGGMQFSIASVWEAGLNGGIYNRPTITHTRMFAHPTQHLHTHCTLHFLHTLPFKLRLWRINCITTSMGAHVQRETISFILMNWQLLISCSETFKRKRASDVPISLAWVKSNRNPPLETIPVKESRLYQSHSNTPTHDHQLPCRTGQKGNPHMSTHTHCTTQPPPLDK